jgi:hypothetical protein
VTSKASTAPAEVISPAALRSATALMPMAAAAVAPRTAKMLRPSSMRPLLSMGRSALAGGTYGGKSGATTPASDRCGGLGGVMSPRNRAFSAGGCARGSAHGLLDPARSDATQQDFPVLPSRRDRRFEGGEYRACRVRLGARYRTSLRVGAVIPGLVAPVPSPVPSGRAAQRSRAPFPDTRGRPSREDSRRPGRKGP